MMLNRKLKVVYIVDYDLRQNSGVVQKILQQTSKWHKLGVEIFYVSTKTLTLQNSKMQILSSKKPLKFKLKKIGTAINVFYNSLFIKDLVDEIKPDLVYVRFCLYTPQIAKILKKYKSIMELNSDDISEYKATSKITYFYNILTRNILLKNIDGFISVSEEIKQIFTYLKKDIKVIANGVDTSIFTPKNNKNQKPIFVFITTSNQPWQGIDKVIKMSENFKEYMFYIIGIKGADTDNLKYFGYLSHDSATEIIQKSDIGIGTLSLYITKLNEASPLKTRQYLACGLPIIYAYDDTDMNEINNFTLKFKNYDENINYSKIKSFVDRVFNNISINKEAREFAENKLDFSIKEKERIEFFWKIYNEK